MQANKMTLFQRITMLFVFSVLAWSFTARPAAAQITINALPKDTIASAASPAFSLHVENKAGNINIRDLNGKSLFRKTISASRVEIDLTKPAGSGVATVILRDSKKKKLWERKFASAKSVSLQAKAEFIAATGATVFAAVDESGAASSSTATEIHLAIDPTNSVSLLDATSGAYQWRAERDYGALNLTRFGNPKKGPLAKRGKMVDQHKFFYEVFEFKNGTRDNHYFIAELRAAELTLLGDEITIRLSPVSQ